VPEKMKITIYRKEKTKESLLCQRK
jgi:hypothetical protein